MKDQCVTIEQVSQDLLQIPIELSVSTGRPRPLSADNIMRGHRRVEQTGEPATHHKHTFILG